MPHRLLAAILIQRDKPHPDKQRKICLEFAEANGLRIHSLCHHWRDCVGLVESGAITQVITAIDPGTEAKEAFEEAGGTLCVVRNTQVRVRRDAHEIAVNMYRRGYDTQEISAILRVNSGDVRRSLWRAGIRQRKPRE